MNLEPVFENDPDTVGDPHTENSPAGSVTRIGLHTRRGCIRSFSAPDSGTKTEALEIALGFENNLAD
jgi:hypothetical protein